MKQQGMNSPRARGVRPALAAACLVWGLAITQAAQAQVECGDIIGPNASATLQGDLLCDAASGGVTVIGPATLDLNGHHIECAAEDVRPVGIALVGRRAVLRNGSVGSCFHGVEVAGVGGHRVERTDSAFNQVHGFYVTSEGNVLRDNRSSGNAVQGFVLQGDRSTLDGNSTYLADGVRNLQDGFRVTGIRNRVRRNEAIGDGRDGFYISAGEGNILTQNEARNAGANGFLDFAIGTRFTGNTASANSENGFAAAGNVAGPGRPRLSGNQATENGRSGIVVGAEGALVSNNTAVNNRRRGSGFDLESALPVCGASTWRRNTFLTANQSCIE